MRFTLTGAVLASILSTSAVQALGINCRGSSLCHLASWENKASEGIMQVLRDAVWQTPKSNSTTYNVGDHIICIAESQSVTVGGSATYNTPSSEGGSGSVGGTFSLGGKLGGGGICLFLQAPSGTTIDLEHTRPLLDALLEHGCGTCGSIPIHLVDQQSNDPAPGILTFNYVAKPYCVGNCISGSGTNHQGNATRRSLGNSARFVALRD